jgi:3-phosphoshikimate 1-carboxyvinyltransferase
VTTEILRRASGPLHGRVRVPGDKSISHRSLVFAGLAEGTSTVTGLSGGDDVIRTSAALRALGVVFEGERISGGRSALREATAVIDLGNSGTGMRLFTGIASSLGFYSVLAGDASLHTRPMGRVTGPLRQMGARIDGRADAAFAPLSIRGGGLSGIDYTPPVASAQVKAAILLAGLAADGETTIHEAIPTRRHTEEFLERCGADVSITEWADGYAVTVRRSVLAPFTLDVPGDPSQAAFFCVAATIIPGSDLVIENVYVGPGRAGFLEVLAEMGADITIAETGPATADLHVRAASLKATEISGARVADTIDEIPILCVAAALAEGTTRVADAAELRVKESDRIETVAAALRALGSEVVTFPDGLEVTGGYVLGDARIDAVMDHRVAMAASIAALAGTGDVEITGFEAVESSWPSFRSDLEGLQ